MVTWDGFKKWIVGRAVAEKSEKKILERQYKEVEESLRLVKEIVNETVLPVPNRSPASLHSASLPSRPNRRKSNDDSLILATRPSCQRSMSSPMVTSFPQELSSACPAVPACETENAPVKRNYSCNGEWEYKDYPVINLPEMTGFGRYRRSVNAPKEWQMQHAQRSLHELKDHVVAYLGDCPPAGMDAEIWRGFKAQHARTNSVASTTSSTSIDEITGTKVSRGFFPSAASSTDSSFRESSSQYRRDSNLSKASVTSPSTDGESSIVSPPAAIRFSPPKTIRPSGRRQYSRHASTTSISPLAVISEVQEITAPPRRKIEKALKFDNNANNESAVASDDEDEFEWADMLELGGGTSKLTDRLHQQSSSKGQANAKITAIRKCIVTSEKPPRTRTARIRRTTVHHSKINKAAERAGNTRVTFPKTSLDHGKPTIQEKYDQEPLTFTKKEIGHARLPCATRPELPLPQQIRQDQRYSSQHPVTGRPSACRTNQWMEKDNQNGSTETFLEPIKGDSMASATSAETLFAGPKMSMVQT
ncbi:uncharacterized protein PV06_09962 [Exophiala oligosperma]|uniref:Uncharacterized protein n=1 Tax=Exophiala oligosperma TaxID=215243 RepID=A0A0D2D6K9_9EURO|nr:uncharacterized protein PV06_09962 [Exophiala oligosperma]KIW37985.1 hypothetical protein PV06_09962 [Exophiala oligosperma]